MKGRLHQFSKFEVKVQDEFAAFRTDFFRPILLPLMRIGVTANMISLASLLVLFGFLWFVRDNPLLASLFILLHVLFDGLDGPMARLQSKHLRMGAFTDMMCDHIGFAIIVSTTIIIGLVDPAFGLPYLLLYILMIVLILLRNLYEVPPKYAVRTKYVFYLLFFVYAISGINLFDYFTALFSVVMVVTCIYDYKVLSERVQ